MFEYLLATFQSLSHDWNKNCNRLRCQLQELNAEFDNSASHSSGIFVGHLKPSHQNAGSMMSKTCPKPVRNSKSLLIDLMLVPILSSSFNFVISGRD